MHLAGTSHAPRRLLACTSRAPRVHLASAWQDRGLIVWHGGVVSRCAGTDGATDTAALLEFMEKLSIFQEAAQVRALPTTDRLPQSAPMNSPNQPP